MSKNNKIKKIYLLIVAAILISAYIISFIYINSIYPQSRYVYYNQGESFTAQNAEITVLGGELLDSDVITANKEISEILLKDVSGTLDDVNLFLLSIEVYNPTNENITVDMTTFHLESGIYSMQFFYPLMTIYNDCGMYADIKAGERKKLILPQPITKTNLSNSEWDNLKNREYSLVTSLYPVKTIGKIEL